MSHKPETAQPLAPALPLLLHLRPLPTTTVYEALITWETYANGDYQCANIGKQVALQVQPNAVGFAVELRTSPPTLAKLEDPKPLENLALRLAALYEHVVVQVAPTGELIQLLNHAALVQNGARLARELRAGTVAQEPVTEAILQFMERQLASPAQVLASLGHDYLYQGLLPDCYAQPLGGRAAKLRQFPNFFDKVALWFAETTTVQPAPEPGQLLLQRQGTLDTQQTDLPAVQRLIEQALRLAPPSLKAAPLPAVLPAPHFCYEAAYLLEAATGRLLHATLRVYARAGLLFNKEYALTLTQL